MLNRAPQNDVFAPMLVHVSCHVVMQTPRTKQGIAKAKYHNMTIVLDALRSSGINSFHTAFAASATFLTHKKNRHGTTRTCVSHISPESRAALGSLIRAAAAGIEVGDRV